MRISKTVTIAAALLLAAGSLPAAAADAAKETSTAATHAGMAAASPDLKMVHAHLHHTVNCLVGPMGDGYDAKELDPCKGEGMGAIPDSAPDKRAVLQMAAEKAKAGLAEGDLDKAKASASEVQSLIGKAM